jgi:hypothetical protein
MPSAQEILDRALEKVRREADEQLRREIKNFEKQETMLPKKVGVSAPEACPAADCRPVTITKATSRGSFCAG